MIIRSQLTEDQFNKWMKDNHYTNINDWNMQENGNGLAYWIKSELDNLFALIYEQGYGKYGKRYTVLIEGFNDFGCFTKTSV